MAAYFKPGMLNWKKNLFCIVRKPLSNDCSISNFFPCDNSVYIVFFGIPVYPGSTVMLSVQVNSLDFK